MHTRRPRAIAIAKSVPFSYEAIIAVSAFSALIASLILRALL